ncbi:heme oxygenase 1, chloroplastic-like protein [Tanacetum coccineum]
MVGTAVGTPVTATEERSHTLSTGGFVDEMRAVAMKMHTKDQSKQGEKETEGTPWPKWEPTIDGYLKFLVDSKHVYTFDNILDQADFPEYAEFRNTGLERAGNLTKDLACFKEGHSIPEPLSPGIDYSLYIEELSKKGPQAIICHFYNTYFAHAAGGRMIGKKDWTRDEKNHCLEETEKSFKFNSEILRLILA